MKDKPPYYEVTIKFYPKGFSIIRGTEEGVLEDDMPTLDTWGEELYKLCETLKLKGCNPYEDTCPICKGTGKSKTFSMPPGDSKLDPMGCSFCAGLGVVPTKKGGS